MGGREGEALVQLLSCLDIIAPALLVDICWQNLMLNCTHTYLCHDGFVALLCYAVCVCVSFLALVSDGPVVVVTAMLLLLLLYV